MKPNKMLYKLVKDLKEMQVPLIIFGAGATGQVVLQSCLDQGLSISAFCDDNIKKKNSFIRDVKVHHTDEINKFFPDACFIISSADIHDMIHKLERCGYKKEKLYSSVELLENYDLSKFNFQKYNSEDTQKGFVEFAVKSTITCQKGFLTPEKVFMRSVDIVITEKCSLKCKDCSNLMQFFDNPINYEEKDLKEAVDLLASYADYIHEVRVIGGEPLMNKEWHLVVDNLVSKPNIDRVVIYTNGMITPKIHQIDSLKHPKVIFNITDYTQIFGEDAPNKKTANLSRFKKQVDKLEEICKKESIDYRRHPPENWTDCGRIENFNRSPEENKKVFRSCCCKNLITMSEGELHRCPFSAQITRLKVIDCESDYVKITNRDEKLIKEELTDLLFKKNVLGACTYCPGRSLSDEQIIPAIQTETVIPVVL